MPNGRYDVNHAEHSVVGAPTPAPHRAHPSSTRLPLDRDLIVETAVDFIDEHGLPHLSMRRLGGVLGVEAMSLYRYVPGREALLDAAVDLVMDRLRQDQEVLERPENGWQDYLQRLAHGVRRVALAHPKVFPLVASRPPEAPWLRPPLRSLAWVESFLTSLQGEGFSDEAVVLAYRGFTSFLLGHLLLEVTAHGALIGPLEPSAGDDHGTSLAPYPTVARLGHALAQDQSLAEFEEALEQLLDRIALLRVGS